jgi:hypothetical protein
MTIALSLVANFSGRKTAITYPSFVGVLGALALGTIVIDYRLTLALYALMGFLFPFLNFAFVYIAEIGDKKFQALATGVLCITYGIGEVGYVGVGYLLQD